VVAVSRTPHDSHDAGFVEVADRCWVARHAWFDVNVSVVGGEAGLVVVDTHASQRAAEQVAKRVRALPGEVVAVVNTHEHFDHTFGNGVLSRTPGSPGIPGDPAADRLPVYAHETAAANTVPAGERIKALYDEEPDDPHREEVAHTEIVPATHTFSSAMVVDLGDRQLELVHPGRGHTGGDLVVRVPDADVLLAGDLVEESAMRNGVPGFGPDCYPLDWPTSLDLVLSLLGAQTVVVPGHGAPVDRDFVHEQRSAIGVVAETIRDLASRGVPVSDALGAAEWPYPAEELADAVRRGYQHLPRASRSLPLL
jgi:glyoxylase-like metal-dependent hydrolase (beta-lactamase superfamily II)